MSSTSNESVCEGSDSPSGSRAALAVLEEKTCLSPTKLELGLHVQDGDARESHNDDKTEAVSALEQEPKDGTDERERERPESSQSESTVRISLPTIARLSTRFQHAQSSMGKFGDLSLIGLALALVSLALLLFFKDEFSKFRREESSKNDRISWYLYNDYVFEPEEQVTSLCKASILCGVYTCLDSLLLISIKSSSASPFSKKNKSVFEVLVPLAFGIATLLCALPLFLTWWRDPTVGSWWVPASVLEQERRDMVVPVSIFLAAWFFYLRIWPVARWLCARGL